MFKKSDGSVHKFAKLSGHTSSQHVFARADYYKTGATLYLTMTATNYVDSA